MAVERPLSEAITPVRLELAPHVAVGVVRSFLHRDYEVVPAHEMGYQAERALVVHILDTMRSQGEAVYIAFVTHVNDRGVGDPITHSGIAPELGARHDLFEHMERDDLQRWVDFQLHGGRRYDWVENAVAYLAQTVPTDAPAASE